MAPDTFSNRAIKSPYRHIVSTAGMKKGHKKSARRGAFWQSQQITF
jgi:hypothetical protein